MLPEAERPAVARALAKKPAERWPNCRAFVEALLPVRATRLEKATLYRPGCGQQLAVPATQQGQETRCPKCHTIFQTLPLRGAVPTQRPRPSGPDVASDVRPSAPLKPTVLAGPPVHTGNQRARPPIGSKRGTPGNSEPLPSSCCVISHGDHHLGSLVILRI
jgi:hypothetical protein